MAIAGIGVAVAAAGVAATARESQIASQQAEGAQADAALRAKQLKDQEAKPVQGVNDSAAQIKRANLLSQQAGGSLLSDPAADRQSGNQTGTPPATGKSLLGA